MVILSQEDRDRFSLWLTETAKEDSRRVSQLISMNFPSGNVMAEMMKIRIAAYELVADELGKI